MLRKYFSCPIFTFIITTSPTHEWKINSYSHSGCSLFESAAYHLDPVTQYALRKERYGGRISQKQSSIQALHRNQGVHAGGKAKRKRMEAAATKGPKDGVKSPATNVGRSSSETSRLDLQQPAMKRPKLHFTGGASASDHRRQTPNSHDKVGSKKSHIQADFSRNEHGSATRDPGGTPQTPASCSPGIRPGASASSDLQLAKNTNTVSRRNGKRRTSSSTAPSTTEDETSASARNMKKSRKKKKSPERTEQTSSLDTAAATEIFIKQLMSQPSFVNSFASVMVATMKQSDGASLSAALSPILRAQSGGEPILSKKPSEKKKKQK